MNPIVIHAVAYEEDGMWVARCLEYNFASCAQSLEALADELFSQIEDQIEADTEAGHPPFFGFKPAPEKYWDQFSIAKAVAEPIRSRERSDKAEDRRQGRTRVEAQLIPIASAA